MASIFMSMTSARLGPINGEATIPGNIGRSPGGGDWIELEGCSFSSVPHSNRGESADVAFNPVEITKKVDGASISLLHDLFTNAARGNAAIVFLRPTPDGPTEYLRLELEDIRLLGFEIQGADDRPTEKYMLSASTFTIITWNYAGSTQGTPATHTIINEAV